MNFWSLVGILVISNSVFSQPFWRQNNFQTTNWVSSIQFLDSNEGWAAISYDSALRHTTDGGASWNAVRLPALSVSMKFTDRNTGFSGTAYEVSRTIDGGISWRTIVLPNTLYRYRIYPVSDSVCWMNGRGTGTRSGEAFFFRYTFKGDGSFDSVTWNPGITSQLSGIQFVNQDTGWSVGSPGLIVRITDATGNTPTFTVQSSGSTQQLNDIFMLNSTTGWIAGRNGTILRTTDGGITWTSGVSGTTRHLNAISFADGLNGFAVGDNGTLIGTMDGGVTWTNSSLITASNLVSVQILAPDLAYVSGQYGTFLEYSAEPVTRVGNLVGNFAPLQVGNRWGYSGSYYWGDDTMRGGSHSVKRWFEILSATVQADATVYRLSVVDSQFRRVSFAYNSLTQRVDSTNLADTVAIRSTNIIEMLSDSALRVDFGGTWYDAMVVKAFSSHFYDSSRLDTVFINTQPYLVANDSIPYGFFGCGSFVKSGTARNLGMANYELQNSMCLEWSSTRYHLTTFNDSPVVEVEARGKRTRIIHRRAGALPGHFEHIGRDALGRKHIMTRID